MASSSSAASRGTSTAPIPPVTVARILAGQVSWQHSPMSSSAALSPPGCGTGSQRHGPRWPETTRRRATQTFLSPTTPGSGDRQLRQLWHRLRLATIRQLWAAYQRGRRQPDEAAITPWSIAARILSSCRKALLADWRLATVNVRGCLLHPWGTGLATQCRWPRPPLAVFVPLTPWVYLGRTVRSCASLPVEYCTGEPERPRELTEGHPAQGLRMSVAFLWFHRCCNLTSSYTSPLG